MPITQPIKTYKLKNIHQETATPNHQPYLL